LQREECPVSVLLKRLSVAGFLFFLLKGLVWLAILVVGVIWVS